MNIQGQVGAGVGSNAIGDGVTGQNFRQGRSAEMIVSELQGRYYEGAYRRARFNAANTAGVTTTVGTATTYVVLCLSNPVGSTVNLAIEKVGLSFLVAFAAASTVGLMVGYNSSTNVTHTTPLAVRNNFVGLGVAGIGLVDSAATLPTAPALSHVFLAGLTGAITTAPTSGGPMLFDLEGSVILPPGAYAAIYTSTASGASGFAGSIAWSEVPV
jgi:hypothetical protein